MGALLESRLPPRRERVPRQWSQHSTTAIPRQRRADWSVPGGGPRPVRAGATGGAYAERDGGSGRGHWHGATAARADDERRAIVTQIGPEARPHLGAWYVGVIRPRRA